MALDLEVTGTFTVGGKLIAAYNKYGEPLYLDPRWEFKDGVACQIDPMRMTELFTKLD